MKEITVGQARQILNLYSGQTFAQNPPLLVHKCPLKNGSLKGGMEGCVVTVGHPAFDNFSLSWLNGAHTLTRMNNLYLAIDPGGSDP
jgi:hypothetical protein